MSHFPVLVLLKKTQNLQELLAPFSENLEVEPYIVTERDEFIKTMRVDYKDIPEVYDLSDDEFISVLREDYHLDDKGNEISTCNKQSKWDWWSVGGRWSDKLKLTKEAYTTVLEDCCSDVILSARNTLSGYCSAAKIKYLDFAPDQEISAQSLRFWELYVDKAVPQGQTEKEMIEWIRRKPEYYIDRFGTKENYAELQSLFHTWAVVTPDGQWHQQGNMGWWACSDDTAEQAEAWVRGYKKKFIDTAKPGWVAVIVDCHI
jgi:hypothetical protein